MPGDCRARLDGQYTPRQAPVRSEHAPARAQCDRQRARDGMGPTVFERVMNWIGGNMFGWFDTKKNCTA
jgi:hypothetical protein